MPTLTGAGTKRRGCARSRSLFDEIRRDIPAGASGLVTLVGAADTEAAIDALHRRAVRITRHRLSATESAALSAAVAEAPSAAPPDA